MSIGRGSAIVLVALATVFAAGCGGTVLDDVKTEETLEQSLRRTGLKVTAVDCPSGVEVEKGNTFECTLSLAGGEEQTTTLEIVNEDADVRRIDTGPQREGSGK